MAVTVPVSDSVFVVILVVIDSADVSLDVVNVAVSAVVDDALTVVSSVNSVTDAVVPVTVCVSD